MSKIPPGTKTILLNGIAVGEIISSGDFESDAEAVREYLKSKGLHKEVTPFKAIFNQALSFANTSAYLFEKDLRKLPRKGVSIAPFVVNSAFAIELYLKALAKKHGVSLRGHELVKLYKALPAKAHAEIEAVIPKCAQNRDLGEEPNFSAYLANLNGSFVEWRYLYESKKTDVIHIEPTIFVMEVLHEACLNKNA